MWLKTKSGIINTDQFIKIFHDREYVKGLYNSPKNVTTHFTIVRTASNAKASNVVDIIYDALSNGEKTINLTIHEYEEPKTEVRTSETILKEIEMLRRSKKGDD